MNFYFCFWWLCLSHKQLNNLSNHSFSSSIWICCFCCCLIFLVSIYLFNNQEIQLSIFSSLLFNLFVQGFYSGFWILNIKCKILYPVKLLFPIHSSSAALVNAINIYCLIYKHNIKVARLWRKFLDDVIDMLINWYCFDGSKRLLFDVNTDDIKWVRMLMLVAKSLWYEE